MQPHRLIFPLLFIALQAARPFSQLTAQDSPPCNEPDPLDCSSPEDFQDIFLNGEAPPVIPVHPQALTPIILEQPPSPPPSEPTPKPAVVKQELIVLPPIGSDFITPIEPGPHITLGIYSKQNEKNPRTDRASLAKGGKYVIEAKCLLPDAPMLDSKVTFKIDAKNGMEYFEQDGYPVGTEHKVPWIYDPISKIYSAQVILRTVTMTSLFKQDIVTAFYPGLSSGKLYIEVIQDAPEIR